MEINLKNVWHSYDGSTFVLRNIDLLFRNSGVYLIVGPNGSGKTTLLKITSLIIKPSRGENIINGKSFWSLDERERENLRSNIIYV
ncbi:MAG: ATP-binding cassette domain-containing protein, partial [Fervidicoccaceae archaeon]